ncbi:MAG: glycosyltransferase family 2 protein [Bdellovibrionota bacterium]
MSEMSEVPHLLSVIIPVYYNAESLPVLYERLNQVSILLKNAHFEFVFVDDRSGDDSFAVLKQLSLKDHRVKVVRLSRNFGSFVACLAGLSYCKGHTATIIAADLQDPPELIVKFYEKWLSGSRVICAVREARNENPIKVFISNIYYRLLRKYALSEMPKGGFDSVMIDRKVIDFLVTTGEKNTSLMGLILWAGFERSYINYTKQERVHGQSRWTLNKKIKYFIDSFLGFSYTPIRAISILGISTAVFALIAAVYVIFQALFIGIDVRGFPTTIVFILVSSAIQMLMIGVLGEYVWRNLEESRKRPVFLVDQVIDGQQDKVVQTQVEVVSKV